MRGRRGRRDYRLSRSGPGAHPGRWRGAQRFSSSSFSPSSYPPNFSSSLTPFPLSLLLLLLSTPWGAHCPHPPSVPAQRFGESAAASLGHVHYGRPCLPSLCPQPQDHWGRVPGSRAPGGGRGTSPARRGSHGGAQAADPGLCPCALRTFFFVWTPSEAGPPPGRRRGRGGLTSLTPGDYCCKQVFQQVKVKPIGGREPPGEPGTKEELTTPC